MAGILANSASKTMTSGSADNSVSGYLVGEQIVLTVTPTGTDYVWAVAKPSGSATARSNLDATTGASVKFTPDAEGYFTVSCVVDSTTTYTLRIAAQSIGTVTYHSASNFSPLNNAQVPVPALGHTWFHSTELGGPAYKVGSTVYPIAGPYDSVLGAAELRAIAPTSGATKITRGYAAAGDGGGGLWVAVTGASAGTYVHNGGTIIVPSGGDGSAAWIRQHDGDVVAAWFGAVGDGATDDAAAILAASTLVNSRGGGVVSFEHGKTYRVSTALSMKRFARVAWDLNGAVLNVNLTGSGIAFDIRSSALFTLKNGKVLVNSAFTGDVFNLNRDPVGGVSDTFYPVFSDIYFEGTGTSGQWGGTALNLDGCIIGSYSRIEFVGGASAVKGIGETNTFSNVHRFEKCTFAQQSANAVLGLGEAWTFDSCVFEPKSDGTISGITSLTYASHGLTLIDCWTGDSSTGTFLDAATVYGCAVVGGFYYGGATAFKFSASEGLTFTGIRAAVTTVFNLTNCAGFVVKGGSLQGALVRSGTNTQFDLTGYTGLTGVSANEESNRYVGQFAGGSDYVGLEVGYQSGVGIANRVAGYVGEVDWTSLGYPFLSAVLCGSTSTSQDAETILATRDSSGNPRARIRTHRNGNHFNGGTPTRPLLQARSFDAAGIDLGLTQDTFDFGTAFVGSGHTVVSYYRVGRLQTFSTTLRATGTSPPAVTLTLASPTVSALLVDIVVGGSRGTATFRTSSDGGATYSATVTTAATVDLGNGITVNFPVGTYNADNVYYATLASLEDLTTSNLDLAQATTNSQPIVEPFRNGQFAFRGGASPADQFLTLDPYLTVSGALTAYVVGKMPASYGSSDMVIFSGAASQKSARIQATTGFPGIGAASNDYAVASVPAGVPYIAKFVIDDANSTVDVWSPYGHVQSPCKPGSVTFNKLFWGASNSGLPHAGLHAALALVSGNVAHGSAADIAVLDYFSRLYDIGIAGGGNGAQSYRGSGTYTAGITPPLFQAIPSTASGGGAVNYDFAPNAGDGYYQFSITVLAKAGSTYREDRWVVSGVLASGTLTLQASASQVSPQGWDNTNITVAVSASGGNLRIAFSHALGSNATGRIHVAYGKQDAL